ncbi:MAG: hypothetical protein J6386_20245 [Candidatus Synoicihabitans palmerolidicus]|nr:hypothetical protein [Candidatus Synoicihabitans palmerolidicus]
MQATTRTAVNAQADLAASFRIGPASALTIVGAALTHYDNANQTRNGTLPAIDLRHPEAAAYPP